MVLAIAACTLAQAAAPQFDAERLRSLAKLPMINLGSGFGADTEAGFTLTGEPLDPTWRSPSNRLAALGEKLKT